MKKAGFVLGLICPVLLFGQITITSSDVPHTIGGYWYMNRVDGASINLGSSTGPWDFTSPALGTDSAKTTIYDRTSTPYSDSCPSATFVEYGAQDNTYAYYRLVQDSLKFLGSSVNVPQAGIVMLKFNPAGNTPLPIQYNNQWVITLTGNFILMGMFPGQVNIRRHCKVDGYGMVITPLNSFSCLRIQTYDTTHITIPNVGIDSTAAFVFYNFYVKNYGVVARIRGDGSNPNITTGVLERITQFYPAVEEAKVVSKTTINHSPNPFYNNVNINYSIANTGETSLKVYDLTGKVVRTLVNGTQSAGNHTTSWDGRDENGTKLATGIYFYELSTSAEKITKKITLLR